MTVPSVTWLLADIATKQWDEWYSENVGCHLGSFSIQDRSGDYHDPPSSFRLKVLRLERRKRRTSVVTSDGFCSNSNYYSDTYLRYSNHTICAYFQHSTVPILAIHGCDISPTDCTQKLHGVMDGGRCFFFGSNGSAGWTDAWAQCESYGYGATLGQIHTTSEYNKIGQYAAVSVLWYEEP